MQNHRITWLLGAVLVAWCAAVASCAQGKFENEPDSPIDGQAGGGGAAGGVGAGPSGGAGGSNISFGGTAGAPSTGGTAGAGAVGGGGAGYGGGGAGGTGATGGMGGSVTTGGSGGSVPTGGSGGSVPAGGSGGSVPTGGSGGSVPTGGSGGSVPTGGSGGSGGGAGACDWTGTVFPQAYSDGSSIGDMTFDAACNLYFVTNSNSVYKVAHNTQNLSTLCSFTGTSLRGIVFNPADGLLYVGRNDASGSGTDADLYSITLAGTETLLANSSSNQWINGITIAPAGWGSYGGQIILAHRNGSVYAFDPQNPALATVGTTSEEVSDVAFDGQTLYMAVYDAKQIQTMSPTGTVASFANTSCSPDGLAIDPSSRVFFACGSTNDVYTLTIPSATPSLYTTVNLSAGWAPSGMIYDGFDTLIVMSGSSGGQLEAH